MKQATPPSLGSWKAPLGQSRAGVVAGALGQLGDGDGDVEATLARDADTAAEALTQHLSQTAAGMIG